MGGGTRPDKDKALSLDAIVLLDLEPRQHQGKGLLRAERLSLDVL